MRAIGLIVAAALLAGCTASVSGEPTTYRVRLDAEMVAYASAPGGSRDTYAAALRSEAEIAAFPGQFAVSAPDIAASLTAMLDDMDVADEHVLIGVTLGSGCFPPKGAELYLVDDRHIDFEPTGPRPTGPVECVRQHTSAAVFAVSRSQLPDDFTPQPTYAGPGRVVVHRQLSYDVDDAAAAEVTERGAFEDFRRSIPGAPRVRLPAATADERTFAFVTFGCEEDSAELIVGEHSVEARLDSTDPDVVIACVQAVPYLVVMRIPMYLVPDGARPG